jgi:hypothetical protein
MEKTALITGCSSGIGRATAEAFLEEEWVVYATARDPDDVADLVEPEPEPESGSGADASDGDATDGRRDRGTAVALELDVTDGDECRDAVERIVDERGRLDALVNNAGYGQHGPVEDVPMRYLARQFDVNVFGPHRLVRAAVPHMRERGEGTVVNVSSVAGRLVAPGAGAYAASKHAIEGYSDALRTELAPTGVDVVVVQPGPVATAFRGRVGRELDKLDRSDDYEWVYDLQEDAAVLGGDSPFAVGPEAVAETIVEASVTPDPDARYVVGGFARALSLAAYLPDRARDGLVRLVRTVGSVTPD